jgi:hypothetical protein
MSRMLIIRRCTCTQAQTKRRSKPGDELDQSIQNMTDKTQDLRKQVCFNVGRLEIMKYSLSNFILLCSLCLR